MNKNNKNNYIVLNQAASSCLEFGQKVVYITNNYTDALKKCNHLNNNKSIYGTNEDNYIIVNFNNNINKKLLKNTEGKKDEKESLKDKSKEVIKGFLIEGTPEAAAAELVAGWLMLTAAELSNEGQPETGGKLDEAAAAITALLEDNGGVE